MLNWCAVLLLLAAGPVGQVKPQKVELAGDPGDKVICKKFMETGSLVRGTRVCKPKRDWERSRDEMRANMTTTNGCKSLDNTGGC